MIYLPLADVDILERTCQSDIQKLKGASFYIIFCYVVTAKLLSPCLYYGCIPTNEIRLHFAIWR